ncbi:MAG: hypothetical protein IJS08_09095 [Victivallales bacterium]|nr:hypothetical protein [Victivallales bacterium]
MRQSHGNLSDTRGNRLGIGFFKVCMAVFGLRFCRLFVWPVAFFYALFDRKAFEAARPYLQSAFSGNLRWHFLKMIVNHGQAILAAQWLRTGHKLEMRDVNSEIREEMLLEAKNGFIMLMSHVGCWQATISRMEGLNTHVNLLNQDNKNPLYAHMMEGSFIRVISNSKEFGGLLEATEALMKHEVLCVMGDRLPDDVPSHLSIMLRGRKIRVPEAPWHLAARCNTPIFIIFTILHPDSIDFIYMPPIRIDYNVPRKPSPDFFTPYLQIYQEALEKIASDFPYQIFHYQ